MRSLRADRTLSLVEVRDRFSIAAALRELAEDPGVIHVEPDQPVVWFETYPDDPLWIEQWNLRKIDAPVAWDRQTSADDVVVALIDTGVDARHPDLAPNLWAAPDGALGYNCVSGLADTTDEYGHGTHVAGILAASANADGDPANDLGIAGLNWSGQLLSLKFVDASGNADVSGAIACFERIRELIEQGVPIRVTNSSWGVSRPSGALRRVMRQAARLGVLHVVAAGNDARDVDLFPVYPASDRLPSLISVASTGISDIPSFFSNFGLASVDLAAPGETVFSTLPTKGCPGCAATDFGYESGTSMAAPLVAGVAASIFQTHATWTPRQIRDLILAGDQVEPLSHASSSGGRLDYGRVREAADATPSAPAANRHPRIVGSIADVILAAGDQVQMTWFVSDVDTEPAQLTRMVRRPAWTEIPTIAPLRWMIALHAPDPPDSGPILLSGAEVDTYVALPYAVSAADGNGGSDLRRFFVTFRPSPGAPPSSPRGALIADPTTGPPGTTVTFTTTGYDPDGGEIAWSLACHGPGTGFEEFVPDSVSYSRTLLANGNYRCRAYLVDDELNVTTTQSVVITIGAASNDPPVARLAVDRQVGTPPLVVQLDASSSTDDDGEIESYYVFCSTSGVAPASADPSGSCTFDLAGPQVVRLTVADDANGTDSVEVPIMVLPKEGEPPTVTLEQPTSGDQLSGTVTLRAQAADNLGVERVEFYVDAATQPVAAVHEAPFEAALDTTTLPSGLHALRARALDYSGNETVSHAAVVEIVNP